MGWRGRRQEFEIHGVQVEVFVSSERNYTNVSSSPRPASRLQPASSTTTKTTAMHMHVSVSVCSQVVQVYITWTNKSHYRLQDCSWLGLPPSRLQPSSSSRQRRQLMVYIHVCVFAGCLCLCHPEERVTAGSMAWFAIFSFTAGLVYNDHDDC